MFELKADLGDHQLGLVEEGSVVDPLHAEGLHQEGVLRRPEGDHQDVLAHLGVHRDDPGLPEGDRLNDRHLQGGRLLEGEGGDILVRHLRHPLQDKVTNRVFLFVLYHTPYNFL